MALLPSCFSTLSPPYSSTMTVLFMAAPVFMKPIALQLRSCPRFCAIASKRDALIVKASTETECFGDVEPQSESDNEEDLLLNEMPVESKLQLKLEQKMRIKISKKIRLRRKKLLHKRRMRKRGRWPPSKINKLKNV
ncbi:50S ribosomal protein 5 alpha, chloroplastic-like [Mangifera indica]|uniref:50S ribosomal protein 5 alpha, chloroplastic-like n=1 Tax=Mangifera indica TaxID=29780 RepID=UPI001CFB7BC7|nr:50S ribosomal protein 5 alpha, chloroplastic-like [Mangifera indica]